MIQHPQLPHRWRPRLPLRTAQRSAPPVLCPCALDAPALTSPPPLTCPLNDLRGRAAGRGRGPARARLDDDASARAHLSPDALSLSTTSAPVPASTTTPPPTAALHSPSAGEGHSAAPRRPHPAPAPLPPRLSLDDLHPLTSPLTRSLPKLLCTFDDLSARSCTAGRGAQPCPPLPPRRPAPLDAGRGAEVREREGRAGV